MPDETAVSTATNASAWQQSTTTDSTLDTPPDSAVLPVRKILFLTIVKCPFRSNLI